MKLKVLIIGGTGYIGKRLVKASLEQGHDTYVLQRSDIGLHVEKVQMLLSFKKQGARLLIGSFDNHRSLVEAVKQVDIVICTISARMGDAMEQGRAIFDEKMVVRKAIEDAGIPFTYVSANCFAGIFVGGLCQVGRFIPSWESVVLYGDGNRKAVFMDEDDVAAYTIRTIDDPRTVNKTVYLRPPANILSQREVVGIWEKLIGKELKKSSLSEQDILNIMKEKDLAEQGVWSHCYHFFYQGCLANFEVEDDAEEAFLLYPDIKYTKMEDYLKQYI
ncbi:3-beta hydroxysteroid dehydrogenase/isomerase [Cynara cardunculus var. scolymus]|uniref:(+)-lariciresinol reductase n=1 Tax=Cynara cardunculus var. scolymus TaxID=59895 RepID=A0A124SBT8_CYNCS|nr:3-beta hydroxysteroid dehydrogenase/isomerase [Cynara cardunculus var. scolymus]